MSVQLLSRIPWGELLPDSVVVAAADHDVDGGLAGDESDAVATALPGRRAEFVTGRVLARRALAALGRRPGSIPVARDGAPVWPAGIVGSITHCVGLRACAVGRRDEHAGIGIDATPARPLPGGVLARVADLGSAPVAAGLDALRATGVEAPGSVLFAAAEAVAKARTSAQGGWHGIDGAEIALHPDGSFAVRARRGPAFTGTGRWAVAGGLALAGIALDEHWSRRAGARRDERREDGHIGDRAHEH
ncbi:4-phosphopantetheinyl transferase [Clavibacter michiganensis subsp. michiganensis]|nr:4-phosphopantetheinyl transferase [Clavibacter michiganensis subsp. michiganensis]MWJ39593.1 4-phosphopantetheinyl transferase [Clavibacter michiganensis subsp. michiganensis]MWJ79292.1 4-phosphopantetheinyl transferase [Clavibacter michiganensis subsp. michiganensis]MWJ82626.1 4-phosphopantetheinyl transferase [Clavibacter michiganensis subsp. michiganensis]MWK63526.1 4-phosphopantetheinyl transferase [Clavibacter michiganensis subsp. michiganensis]